MNELGSLGKPGSLCDQDYSILPIFVSDCRDNMICAAATTLRFVTRVGGEITSGTALKRGAGKHREEIGGISEEPNP